jgi:anti-sigma-K factor RskA
MTAPRDPGHERWDELAAGYALDALEPAEEAELMAHLDECDICRGALRDHELVAAQLAALADDADVTPPAWSSIRTGIVGAAPATGADGVVDLSERRARRFRPARILTAAAAAVVIVAGVVTAVTVTGGDSSRDAAISACRAQSTCHVVELSRGSHERAVVLVRNNDMQLLPTHLSALRSGRVYALWQLPRDGKPTLLRQPVAAGRDMTAQLALPYDDTAAFALSVEPAGPPASAPTTVVAVGTATT